MQESHCYLSDIIEAKAVFLSCNTEPEHGIIDSRLGTIVYFGDLPTFSIKYRAPIDPYFLGGCV